MKKVSLIKAITLFLGVFSLTVSLFQCTKVGDNIQHLDRSYPSIPDSTIYAPFNDNFTIATADVTPATNDVIKMRGVQTILHEYCATSNCHGGPISPKFNSYADIMKLVVAGKPEQSKLWEMITTNDFNKAMPPVNSNHEMNTKDKAIIYNWIYNGAKENPNLADFRPAAIRLIVDGCGSANCHNQATVAGSWAEKDIAFGSRYSITTTDTASFYIYDASTGAPNRLCQLINKSKLSQIWKDYKDSVKTYYGDTINKTSFRILKTFTTPWTTASRRGPLGSYDDILMDISVPKNIRSNSSVVYTSPGGVQYYSKQTYLNSDDCFIRRIDSTLIFLNPNTGKVNAASGSMAYQDGGLKPSEIALIKAWYFADPNIPDVWKYGLTNTGIFKYTKSGNFIVKH